MADLDPISTLRPIHRNQQRQPKKKQGESDESKEQRPEKPREEPRSDSEHEVDDYA